VAFVSEFLAAEIDVGALAANAAKAANRPPHKIGTGQRRDVDTGAHASVTSHEPISRKIANNFAKSRKRAGVLCARLNARLRATTKAAVRIRMAVGRWQEERASAL
jgi:hypothetical protein